MKHHNDESDKIADWSNTKLKKEAESLYDCIYGANACYSCKDIMLLDGICLELRNRGYEVEESCSLSIKR